MEEETTESSWSIDNDAAAVAAENSDFRLLYSKVALGEFRTLPIFGYSTTQMSLLGRVLRYRTRWALQSITINPRSLTDQSSINDYEEVMVSSPFLKNLSLTHQSNGRTYGSADETMIMCRLLEGFAKNQNEFPKELTLRKLELEQFEEEEHDAASAEQVWKHMTMSIREANLKDVLLENVSMGLACAVVKGVLLRDSGKSIDTLTINQSADRNWVGTSRHRKQLLELLSRIPKDSTSVQCIHAQGFERCELEQIALSAIAVNASNTCSYVLFGQDRDIVTIHYRRLITAHNDELCTDPAGLIRDSVKPRVSIGRKGSKVWFVMNPSLQIDLFARSFFDFIQEDDSVEEFILEAPRISAASRRRIIRLIRGHSSLRSFGLRRFPIDREDETMERMLTAVKASSGLRKFALDVCLTDLNLLPNLRLGQSNIRRICAHLPTLVKLCSLTLHSFDRYERLDETPGGGFALFDELLSALRSSPHCTKLVVLGLSEVRQRQVAVQLHRNRMRSLSEYYCANAIQNKLFIKGVPKGLWTKVLHGRCPDARFVTIKELVLNGILDVEAPGLNKRKAASMQTLE